MALPPVFIAVGRAAAFLAAQVVRLLPPLAASARREQVALGLALAPVIALGFSRFAYALLLPPIAYGDAWNNRGFPGTLSLAPATVRAIVGDIGRGLHAAGLRALLPDDASLLAQGLRFARYALIGLWIAAGAPALFRKIGLAD